MRTTVTDMLKNIADQRDIRILFACETGSRAWGFPSPDSDYDIRFIYMHKRDWYLSLSDRKDTIEYMDGDLDITGWDLRKCLQLLKRSNAPLIERFQSPIRYFEQPPFATEFKQLAEIYYSPTAVFYHHYSLAQKFWEELKSQEDVKLKSYFYLLRSLLSCHWIIQDKSLLPMDIEGLMKKIDPERRDELRKLIRIKAGVTEKYLHPKEKELNSWIRELFEMLEQSKNNLGVCEQGQEKLNTFFLKMVNTHDDV
jgi:predicted nucleotidyltransferase